MTNEPINKKEIRTKIEHWINELDNDIINRIPHLRENLSDPTEQENDEELGMVLNELNHANNLRKLLERIDYTIITPLQKVEEQK